MPPSEIGGSESGLTLLAPGTLFHQRYEVLRCIGAGGMGAVYEVLQLSTRRRRALKTMLPGLLSDVGLRARFTLEATITAEVESEHIVEVFDAGFDESTGLPFLLMEYLRGENLARLLHRHGPMPPTDVVTLLNQASLALDRTHSAGIVHRDLKPENLFLTLRDDGRPRLKLLDFGIAKVFSQSANLATTRNLGTPLYMAPEQIRGDSLIDGRADLYSLGQIAFSLLVGHAYWEPELQGGAGLYGVLLKVVEGARDPASVRASRYRKQLPDAFDNWFAQATHPMPEERFDTASAFVDSLALALGVNRTATATRSKHLAMALGQPTSTNEVQQSTLVGVAAYYTGGPHITPAEKKNSSNSKRRPAVTLAVGIAIISIALVVGWVQWWKTAPRAEAASASAIGVNSESSSSLTANTGPIQTAQNAGESAPAIDHTSSNHHVPSTASPSTASPSTASPSTASPSDAPLNRRHATRATDAVRRDKPWLRVQPNSAPAGQQYDPSDKR